MIKSIKAVLIFLFLIGINMPSTAKSPVGKDTAKAQTKSFDWEPVIKAIIQVESEGNCNAVKGNSCGAMQITPILVKECNNILKKRNMKKRFTLRDRYSLKKSKEMFLIIQSFFNPTNDVEKAIRSWNGGPKYSKSKTQCYYEKVMKQLRNRR